MKHQTRAQTQILCLCFLLLGGSVIGAEDLPAKCGPEIQNLAPCLPFATASATTPTKECCDAATRIKNSSPECLCYIIQQTHGGSQQVKALGIKEARLLQLPSACKLHDANVTNCPKLLGLPANSPDAAIFTNTSSSANSTNASGPQSQNDSFGSTLKPHLFTDIMAVASAILLLAFPTSGFLSNFT